MKKIDFTEIGKLMQENKKKLAIAESCTGGLVSHMVTNMSGCSAYYRGGIVAYDYGIKETVLGVSKQTLIDHGAVSMEVSREMAAGARRLFACPDDQEDVIGLSLTGIAGPSGGLPGKPVGLVWISLSTAKGTRSWKYVWSGNREENKESSADQALRILLEYLKCGDFPEARKNN